MKHTGSAIACLFIAFLLPFCSRVATLTKEDRSRIDESIKEYSSTNWERRRNAIITLSAYSTPVVTPVLLNACDDTHLLVRIEAVKGLKKHNTSTVKHRIRTIAEYDRNGNLRWQALLTLAVYRDPTTAPAFVKGLSSEDPLVREASIKGLLAMDDYTIKYVSIPYIVQAIDDPSINVKLAAISSLNIKDPRIYKKLTELLREDITNKHTLLIAILRALEGYQLDAAARKRVTALMVHQNKEVRLQSLRVLKKDNVMRTQKSED